MAMMRENVRKKRRGRSNHGHSLLPPFPGRSLKQQHQHQKQRQQFRQHQAAHLFLRLMHDALFAACFSFFFSVSSGWPFPSSFVEALAEEEREKKPAGLAISLPRALLWSSFQGKGKGRFKNRREGGSAGKGASFHSPPSPPSPSCLFLILSRSLVRVLI